MGLLVYGTGLFYQFIQLIRKGLYAMDNACALFTYLLDEFGRK